MLFEIGRATLQDLTRAAGETAIHTSALVRLARSGDVAALKELRSAAAPATATDHSRQLSANLGLASMGERSAIEWLEGRIADARPNDVVLILDAMAASGVRVQESTLDGVLAHRHPVVRASAARAAGRAKAYGSMPRLRELLNDPIPLVRLNAAASLRALGDVTGERQLAEGLKSEVVEMRIGAAEAFVDTNSREWIGPMRALLKDESVVSRLRAAELLFKQDPENARRVVLEALGDPNPAVRADAARILERAGTDDLAAARQLLRDQSHWVRLYGAGTLVNGQFTR